VELSQPTLHDLHLVGKLDEQERAKLRIPATGPLLYAFPPSAKAP